MSDQDMGLPEESINAEDIMQADKELQELANNGEIDINTIKETEIPKAPEEENNTDSPDTNDDIEVEVFELGGRQYTREQVIEALNKKEVPPPEKEEDAPKEDKAELARQEKINAMKEKYKEDEDILGVLDVAEINAERLKRLEAKFGESQKKEAETEKTRTARDRVLRDKLEAEKVLGVNLPDIDSPEFKTLYEAAKIKSQTYNPLLDAAKSKYKPKPAKDNLPSLKGGKPSAVSGGYSQSQAAEIMRRGKAMGLSDKDIQSMLSKK